MGSGSDASQALPNGVFFYNLFFSVLNYNLDYMQLCYSMYTVQDLELIPHITFGNNQGASYSVVPIPSATSNCLINYIFDTVLQVSLKYREVTILTRGHGDSGSNSNKNRNNSSR